MSPQYSEPRLVYPVMKKSGDLGVRLVGGNAVGIFIHSVDIDSPAYNVGLRGADQILEYNGTDLRKVIIIKLIPKKCISKYLIDRLIYLLQLQREGVLKEIH